MRYSYNVDVSNLNTSHSMAVLSVPPGSRVLDIGSADGSVARALIERGCLVTGIEIDETRARHSAPFCQQVIVGDVEDGSVRQKLGEQKFDVVLMLDVLEHLKDPLAVLTFGRERLEAGGRVVVSIPNVTHGAVRLSLMRGEFTYTDTGILDRTHLRFFDRASGEAMLFSAGLRIAERLRVTRALHETEIPIDVEALPPALVAAALEGEDATTYQFIFVATDGHPLSAAGHASLAELFQGKVYELEARCRDLESLVQSNRDERERRELLIENLERRADRGEARCQDLESLVQSNIDERDRRGVLIENLERRAELAEARCQELESVAQSSLAEIDRRGDAIESLARRAELAEARCQELDSVAQSSLAEIDRRGVRIESLERVADRSEARAAELAAELTTRMQELEERHRDIRSLRADVAVREAFVAHSRAERDQWLADRDRLAADRDGLAADRHRLTAEINRLAEDSHRFAEHRRDLERDYAAAWEQQRASLLADYQTLLRRHTEIEEAHTALQRYSNSAGFRIVNSASIWLRRYPGVYRVLRSAVRRSARRAPGV